MLGLCLKLLLLFLNKTGFFSHFGENIGDIEDDIIILFKIKFFVEVSELENTIVFEFLLAIKFQ